MVPFRDLAIGGQGKNSPQGGFRLGRMSSED